VKWYYPAFTFLLSSNIAYGSSCGSVFDVEIGPWDYSSPIDRRKNLSTVERRHFTNRVENLISGESTNEVMDDLAYTLNKFPNHYRALHSVIRYDSQLNGVLPKVPKYPFPQTVECYFERAFQFKDNDPYLYQLYGIYLYKNNDFKEAKKHFLKSESIKPSAEAHYNLGLVYFELDDLENSKRYAEKAYSQNFPMTGLKMKLQSKGISL